MTPGESISPGSPGTAGPFRRVLVAWDGSPDSVAALRVAAALVAGGPGQVVALAVLPDHAPAEAEPSGEAIRPAPVQDPAQRTWERVLGLLGLASRDRIGLRTAYGHQIAEVLCSHAREQGFDLLVLGRHGDGGILHPRLGHVAQAAARASTVPVLLVGDR
jgi:nucleotide-binding universal stress UspA family protein